MNRIFAVILTLLLSVASFASEKHSFRDVGIGADLIVHIGGLIEDCKDARSFALVNSETFKLKHRIKEAQLPNIYRLIGKGFGNWMISLDVPRWSLAEAIPGFMKTIIHDWYLKGRKEPDTYRKTCFLMAAGRAGHYYAAEEAGQILMNDQEGAIPAMLTLEDLITVVPELSIPAVQRWEIGNMHEDLIADEFARNSYEKYRTLETAVDSFVEAWAAFGSRTEVAIKLYEDMVRSSLDVLSSESEFLETCTKNSGPEAFVVKNILDREKEAFEFKVINEIIWILEQTHENLSNVDPDDEAAQRSERSTTRIRNMKTSGPGLTDYLKAKVKNLSAPELLEYELKNSDFLSFPAYWMSLSKFYASKHMHGKNGCALLNILEKKAIPRVYKLVADNLLNSNPVLANLSLAGLKEATQRAREFQSAACLLDGHEFLDVLQVGNRTMGNYKACLLTKASEAGSEDEINALFNGFRPMTAFMVQLNILRHPELKQVYEAADIIYADDFGNRPKSDAFEGIVSAFESALQ